MTLKDFKLKMISELSSIYEMDELNSIFNLLSEDYLKIPRSKILLDNEIDLNKSNQNLFSSALQRLKTHEPIQYVLGKTNFMDLEFKVNSSVLIPRPETEELVRLMLKEDLDGKEILDIGTGSGCIAISLAKNLPNSKVSGLDTSKDALKVAEENAKLNNVNIEFIHADIFEYKLDKKYDVIVSNPPYVLESEKPSMKQNVLVFEPHLALFVSDENPLIFYDRILNIYFKNLKSNGMLCLEINSCLKKEFNQILEKIDDKNISYIKDFENNYRFILLKK